jgi:hypothetical protein
MRWSARGWALRVEAWGLWQRPVATIAGGDGGLRAQQPRHKKPPGWIQNLILQHKKDAESAAEELLGLVAKHGPAFNARNCATCLNL